MGTALIILAAIGGLVCTIGIGFLKDEAVAWAPYLNSWIVKFASRRLSLGDSKRYAEEWSSHVAEYPGNLSRFFQSLMCLRASFKLRPISKRTRELILSYGAINVSILVGAWVLTIKEVLIPIDEPNIFVIAYFILFVPFGTIAHLVFHFAVIDRFKPDRTQPPA